jgi:hypothetical protein
MIKYTEIENLPANHPLVLEFMKQEAERELEYARNYQETIKRSVMDDYYFEDNSLDHFNRYIAGDRA